MPNKENYDEIIRAAAKTHGVPEALIRAMIKQESNSNPNAVSGKGAQGLMQLMPGTAKELGVKNSLDPKQNIFGGTKYISSLLKYFADKSVEYGGESATKLALAAYNAGLGNVQKHKGIPKFRETQDYVEKISKNYAPDAQEHEITDVNSGGKQMQRFSVKSPSGKVYTVEGDSAPTPEEEQQIIRDIEGASLDAGAGSTQGEAPTGGQAFIKGVKNRVGGMAKGLGSLLSDPIGTLESIPGAAYDRGQELSGPHFEEAFDENKPNLERFGHALRGVGTSIPIIGESVESGIKLADDPNWESAGELTTDALTAGWGKAGSMLGKGALKGAAGELGAMKAGVNARATRALGSAPNRMDLGSKLTTQGIGRQGAAELAGKDAGFRGAYRRGDFYRSKALGGMAGGAIIGGGTGAAIGGMAALMPELKMALQTSPTIAKIERYAGGKLNPASKVAPYEGRLAKTPDPEPFAKGTTIDPADYERVVEGEVINPSKTVDQEFRLPDKSFDPDPISRNVSTDLGDYEPPVSGRAAKGRSMPDEYEPIITPEPSTPDMNAPTGLSPETLQAFKQNPNLLGELERLGVLDRAAMDALIKQVKVF